MSFIKHSGIHSKKYAQNKSKKLFGLFSLLIGCLVIIIGSSIYLLRADFIQIKNVVVDGSNTTIPIEDLQNKTLLSLRDNYMLVIPFANIILFPKNTLEEILRKTFLQIESIDIHRVGWNKISLLIREHAPVALACSGFRNNNLDNDFCYYANKDGYVFGKVATSSTSSTNFNRYYIPTDTADITAGMYFVNRARFHDLQKFLEGSLKAGIIPLGVLIGDTGDYEMYIKDLNSTTTETTVYFDDKAPFETTLSNLVAFWQSSKGKKSFDYINLRFGKTIYYSNQ
jgi:hypothetical protein